MHITVSRTGGFGGRPRWAELETAGLADADAVAATAREALADGNEERPVGVPDGFSYEIVVDGETRFCADPRLTDAQRGLITRVLNEGA
jgi:emfourin